MASQVTYYWRTRIDEPPEEWKNDRAIWWSGETIWDLRRRLVRSNKNDSVIAENRDVFIITFDAEGKLLPHRRVCFNCWTSDLCPEVFEYNHRPGKFNAFLLFTFPQNKPASQDETVFDMFKQVKQSIEITHEEMSERIQKIQLGIQNISKIVLDNNEVAKNIREIMTDTRNVCEKITEVSDNTARLLARSLEFGD
jgi:hypothetical protein